MFASSPFGDDWTRKSSDEAMLAARKSIMLGRRFTQKRPASIFQKRARRRNPAAERQLRADAVVTAARLAPLADSQPPRRLCKKRTGTASGPTAVARARAQSHSWQATRDDWRRSHSCFVAMDSSETATCGSGRADIPVRQPFDPPPTARLLGTALVMIKKQPLKTVRFLKLRPR